MTSPRAAVLMGMDRDSLMSLIRARVQADRDPAIVDVIETLSAVSKRSRGIDPVDWPERVLRRHPRIHLSLYVRAVHRNHLEYVRRSLVREFIGTADAPIPLTEAAAERLVALIDSWESNGTVPADRADFGTYPAVPAPRDPSVILPPHPVWPAPDEGTSP